MKGKRPVYPKQRPRDRKCYPGDKMKDRDRMILGVDPGFASFGYAVVNQDLMVEELGTLVTLKSCRDKRIKVSTDNLRRARELTRYLHEIIGAYGIRLVCAEAMSYPRHASSAGKLMMAWGILAAVCETLEIPIVEATPQEIKKAVVGRRDASKAAVQYRLCRDVEGASELYGDLTKGAREHACDALGAVIASKTTDIFRATVRAR